jgi:hypothetical protein
LVERWMMGEGGRTILSLAARRYNAAERVPANRRHAQDCKDPITRTSLLQGTWNPRTGTGVWGRVEVRSSDSEMGATATVTVTTENDISSSRGRRESCWSRDIP